jgi:L-lysine exporter family protein LysE/ArgO
VLRQGVAHDQVFLVCLLSSLIDASLIILGAVGLGSLIATMPWLVPWASWGGALFLIVFGLLSVHRAIKPETLKAGKDDKPVSSWRKATLLTLAFGFLNPHVYLDTVILLGSIAAGYEVAQRIYFVLGAILASFTWFFAVGYGARFLAPLLQTQTGARLLDTAVAAIMFLVAANLIISQLAATG